MSRFLFRGDTFEAVRPRMSEILVTPLAQLKRASPPAMN